MDRLRRRGDVERVFQHGRAWASRLAVVRYVRTRGDSRLTVAVGRRVGGAVRRNRLRRRWREVVRLGPPLRSGFDVVLVARAAGERASVEQLRSAWTEALGRTGLGR